jgi:lipoate-protein ligase B
METELEIQWLGRVPYAEALELQEKAVEARRAGAAGDRLLLLEHPPVITLGRRAAPEHLLLSAQELAARGIEVHRIGRGGDVTYHGPGQLVGYPILDLRARGRADVHLFLRTLEGCLMEALAELGIAATRLPGYTGVFAAPSSWGSGSGLRLAARASRLRGVPTKIASIGVGLRGWVTFHGFALNVAADLSGFEAIIPCGLHGVRMTSVARELGLVTTPPDLLERATRAVGTALARGL